MSIDPKAVSLEEREKGFRAFSAPFVQQQAKDQGCLYKTPPPRKLIAIFLFNTIRFGAAFQLLLTHQAQSREKLLWENDSPAASFLFEVRWERITSAEMY